MIEAMFVHLPFGRRDAFAGFAGLLVCLSIVLCFAFGSFNLGFLLGIIIGLRANRRTLCRLVLTKESSTLSPKPLPFADFASPKDAPAIGTPVNLVRKNLVHPPAISCIQAFLGTMSFPCCLKILAFLGCLLGTCLCLGLNLGFLRFAATFALGIIAALGSQNLTPVGWFPW